MNAALRAGLAYFAVVFGVGFALGAVRVPLLVPRLGERWAELVETPFMLAAIVLAGRWAVHRFAVPRLASARWAMGSTALALILGVELTVVRGLRGLSLEQAVLDRDPVAGSVYVAMLLFFALWPWALAWATPRA